MTKENNPDLMTFGEHMEVLRRMLFRIIAVACILSIIFFLTSSLKKHVFSN